MVVITSYSIHYTKLYDKGVLEGLDTRKQGLDTRIDQFELRLDRREEFLIKRFTALEEAMALAQTQLAWLQSSYNFV